MSSFTELQDIEVQLRYLERVRGMQPSEAAIERIDSLERGLRERRKNLLASAANGASADTRATTHHTQAKRSTGFNPL